MEQKWEKENISVSNIKTVIMIKWQMDKQKLKQNKCKKQKEPSKQNDYSQTSRNLLRSCQSFGLTDMKILSDRKIFCRSEKKNSQKFTVTCIMFSLAFLEWFTLILAIGHLISPLVFIEVKVIQFSVFSVVQNCICYVFYSMCLEFCCFDDLVL